MPISKIIQALQFFLGLIMAAQVVHAAAPDNSAIAGIYEGTLTLEGREALHFGAVAIGNGETRFIASNGLQIVASFDATSQKVHGSGMMYAPTKEKGTPINGVLADGSKIAVVKLEGTLNPAHSLSGTLSGGGESGKFDLKYLPIYERFSNLKKLAGNYRSANAESTFRGSIDEQGRLSGSDARGKYVGIFSIIDPLFNAYRVHITYILDGGDSLALAGIATLNDDNAKHDERLLQLQLSNGESRFFSEIVKMTGVR